MIVVFRIVPEKDQKILSINLQNPELIIGSPTERNIQFSPFSNPFDIVLGGTGMMHLDGPFLGQLLSVPTIIMVLSCQ